MDDQKTPQSASAFIQSLLQRNGATTLAKEPVAPPIAAEAAAAMQNPVTKVGIAPDTDKSIGTLSPAMAVPAASEAVEVAAAPSNSKLQVAIKALKAMERNVSTIIKLLEEEPAAAVGAMASFDPSDLSLTRELELAGVRSADGRVVEGVFDGHQMIGSDGKPYAVPPNYASKSKLVEGDMLKVTITPRGNFIFKQIGPIERANVIATLGFDATIGEYFATTEDKRWSLLKASITFFKGEPGDDVALLVPKGSPSKWAAVENVIKKNPLA